MNSLIWTAAVGAGVFAARFIQNAIGTARDILVIRGQRTMVFILSFAETSIWFVTFGIVFTSIFKSLWPQGVISFLAFALGYAAGSYLGIHIEERMAFGYVTLQVISDEKNRALGRELRRAGFPMTTLKGRGMKGPKTIYQSVIPRRQLPDYLRVVREIDPDAFITIMDTKSVIRKGRMRA